MELDDARLPLFNKKKMIDYIYEAYPVVSMDSLFKNRVGCDTFKSLVLAQHNIEILLDS